VSTIGHGIDGCCACATVTPTPQPATPTACETFPPPALTFQFSAQPAHPIVGDPVQLSFSVSGRGGLPAYTLSGTAPILEGDTSTVVGSQLGTVTFALTAVQAGTATLTLSVNYETSLGCVGQPIYQFVSETSPPFTVGVADGPNPTPTPTPMPTATVRVPQFCDPTPCPPGLLCVIDPPFQSRVCACIGDCDDDYETSVDELVMLVNAALGEVTVSTCRLGDANGDDEISVDEILQAVNNALLGCGNVPLVATPTPYLGTAAVFQRSNGEAATPDISRFCQLPRLYGLPAAQ